jgi:hypothetical protein
MLSGAPPPTLSNTVVAWHPQTWRLREYHLLLPEDLGDEAKVTAAVEHPRYKPLSPGDPLRAYLPQGLTVDHAPNGVNVYEPGRVADTFYHRCPAPEYITAEYAERIREILIAGEVRAHFPIFGVSHKMLIFLFGWDYDNTFYLRCDLCSFVHQGHSAWGEFELIGRVRAGDGMVTLSKEYVSLSARDSDSLHHHPLFCVRILTN